MENQSSQAEIYGNDLCIGKILSEAEKAAMDLRLLMKDKVGDEKCALCKASAELEKFSVSQFNNSGWSLPFLIMMLIPLWGGTNDLSFMTDAMKVYLDMVEKERKEKEDFHFKTVAEADAEKEAH